MLSAMFALQDFEHDWDDERMTKANQLRARCLVAVVAAISLYFLQPHTHTLTHSLTITCTCCYDEIKGTQDLKIYSHADSQILSVSSCAAVVAGTWYLLTCNMEKVYHLGSAHTSINEVCKQYSCASIPYTLLWFLIRTSMHINAP